jgi:hypothetical protein
LSSIFYNNTIIYLCYNEYIKNFLLIKIIGSGLFAEYK